MSTGLSQLHDDKDCPMGAVAMCVCVNSQTYQRDRSMTMSERVRLMREASAACHKHPKYQAKRPPTAKCKECLYGWRAAEALLRPFARALR